MDAKDFEKFARSNDGRVVVVKFFDGVTRLYQIRHYAEVPGEPGEIDFYPVDVDPQNLPIIGKPFGFEHSYIKDLIPLVEEN